MEFRVIIPVRYHSTRFPGKVLANIGGKPMLEHVYNRALDSGAEDVVIAADDKRIEEVAKSFGANVCMTSSDHQSGTERLAEAVVALGLEDDEIIVCLQGDEPLIPSEVIRQVAADLDGHDNVKVSTICETITDIEELFDPNIVKVVMNRRNYAMYFSRAPIPWERDSFQDKNNIQLTKNHFRHVGIYAYRVGFLQEYMQWDACFPEKMECLEQLRILWHGSRIHMLITKDHLPPGVDTKEDLARVCAYYGKKKNKIVT